MNLLDIKQHMMEVKMASLSSLSVRFHGDTELLRAMLAHWVRKGKLRQCMKTPRCGVSCGMCSAHTTEIYEWIDQS